MKEAQAIDEWAASLTSMFEDRIVKRLGELRDALKTAESEFDKDADALESAMANVRKDVADDANDVVAAHDALQMLLTQLELAEDAEEDSESEAADEGLAAATVAAIASLSAASRAAVDDVEAMADATEAPHEEARNACDATSDALGVLLGRCKSAFDELKESVATDFTQVESEVTQFETGVNGLLLVQGSRLQEAKEMCEQLAQLVEKSADDLVDQAQRQMAEAGRDADALLAQQLSAELANFGRQVQAACDALGGDAIKFAQRFDDDVGSTLQKLNEIADLIEKIKPLVEAIDALL